MSTQYPWGDQGTQIESKFAHVHEVMKNAHLDYEVGLENVWLADGTQVPKTKVTRRKDNGIILATVGDRYNILQNALAFEWFQPFIDAGQATIEHAGTLKKGAIVFAQAKVIIDPVEITPGDVVESYITLLNSHTGATSILAGFFPRRIFCQNQLPALKASNMLKIKHTKSMHISMEKISEIMNVSTQEFIATTEQYKFLASKAVDRKTLEKYVKIVFQNEKNEEAEIRESKIEQIEYLFQEGRGSKETPDTMFKAFNAVNEWFNYESGRSIDTRMYSLWNGVNAQLNQRSLDIALQITNGNI
jgi:phage/plasmid-like protein (TIGR03299 family)